LLRHTTEGIASADSFSTNPGAAQDRRHAQNHQLLRMEGSSIMAPRRSNIACQSRRAIINVVGR
jgi:hypothetical protein